MVDGVGMDLNTIVTTGIFVLVGVLGAIWWEIRTLRKSTHGHANHITTLYGRCGLLEHRVGVLEAVIRTTPKSQ